MRAAFFVCYWVAKVLRVAAKGFFKQKWVLRNADNSSPVVR